MFRKFIFLAIILTAVTAAFAQETPAPKADSSNLMFFGNPDGGYLGIQGIAITNENLSQFGLKEARGVGIDKVVENSPAAAAGLQKGDVVIRFDGEEVKSSSKLSRMIAEVAPDQKAKLTVLRGGEEREITVTMGKRPAMSFQMARPFPGVAPMNMPNMPVMPTMPVMPNIQEFKLTDEMFKGQTFEFPKEGNFTFQYFGGRKIGVVSEPLTKQLGEHYGVAGGKGLLVMEVRADGPAAKAGLKAGDIIIEANGTAVAEANDLARQINAKKEGDIEITILRDKNRQTLKITPEASKEMDFPGFEARPGSFVMPRVPVAPAAFPAAPAAPSAVQMIAPIASSIGSTLRCIL